MPSGRDIPLLLLGVIGIGTSGPVIALSAMPIITLIFWRNLGGALIMAPFALRNGQWLKSENRRGLAWSMAAGFVLALHFIGFFIAMRYTTVAAGTALTALQPFIGDIAAIICAALAALYVLLGSKAQQTLATSTYTTLCYLTCSLTALPIALISGVQLIGFEAEQWWLLLALILGAQILGHTMFNFSLKRVSPAIVSLIVFFEVPVGALLAFWWLDQLPPLGTVPGLILLLAGCAIFVMRSKDEEKG